MNKAPVWLCASLLLGGLAFAAGKNIVTDTFPEEQAKIAEVLERIVDAAQKKDIPRLESFHLYSPKYTKFEDDGLGRQDAEAARKGERDGIVSVKALTIKVENLKIDVYGSTAVATCLIAYEVDTGKEKVAGKDRTTVVFVKEGGAWKIVHEHSSSYKPTP